jgi:hypothetical protein
MEVAKGRGCKRQITSIRSFALRVSVLILSPSQP